MKKRIFALCLAGLCLLSGCKAPINTAPSAPVDTVRVSSDYFGLAFYNSGSFDPLTDTVQLNRTVSEALYEGLFELTDRFTAVPVLCESFEGDGSNFLFTIRKDVQFWDGTPLSAADVADSLARVWQDDSSPWHARLADVTKIANLGTKVRITLSAPNVNFPQLLDMPICKSEENGYFTLGTGPYMPEKDGSGWVLVANPFWHDGFLGCMRRITLLSTVQTDAAVSAFRTGDVTLLRAPRVSAESTVISGNVDSVAVKSTDFHYIGFNFHNDSVQSAALRQALSLALDREKLCATQLQTFADPAVLPVQPSPDGVTASFSADVDGALALLADTELPALTLAVPADNAFKVAVAEQLALSWSAIGVTVEVVPVEAAQYLETVRSGACDLYYGETRMMPDFDPRPLLTGSLNFGGFSAKTLEKSLAAYRDGTDPKAFYTAFLDELPLLPLAFTRDQIMLRQGIIKNFAPAPDNAFAGQEKWEISE